VCTVLLVEGANNDRQFAGIVWFANDVILAVRGVARIAGVRLEVRVRRTAEHFRVDVPFVHQFAEVLGKSVVVLPEGIQSQRQALEVDITFSAPYCGAPTCNSAKQDAAQNGDDAEDKNELYEGETLTSAPNLLGAVAG
jgi:hypothetical protein